MEITRTKLEFFILNRNAPLTVALTIANKNDMLKKCNNCGISLGIC